MREMFRYDTDDQVTRIGYMAGDVFAILFGVWMIWGMFLRPLFH